MSVVARTMNCPKCNALYELSFTKVRIRDQDSIKCELCGTEIHRWSEAKVWEARLLEKGNESKE